MDEQAVRRAATKTKQWTERLENAIEVAYRAGLGLNQLAAASGRSVEGVRQLLLRRGVELRPPHVR